MATRGRGVRARRGLAGQRGWGCDLVTAVSVTARDLRLQSRYRPEIELAYQSSLFLSEPKPHSPELYAKVHTPWFILPSAVVHPCSKIFCYNLNIFLVWFLSRKDS